MPSPDGEGGPRKKTVIFFIKNRPKEYDRFLARREERKVLSFGIKTKEYNLYLLLQF